MGLGQTTVVDQLRRIACACALCFAGVAAAQPASPEVHPQHWPRVAAPLPRDAALEARLDALLPRMTLAEKVGQIVQADIGSVTPEDVRRYRLGSVLAGGNSDPGGKYNATPQAWLALADAFYEASIDIRGGGQAIPVIFGVDAVHGHNNVVGATLFPQNIGLGAMRDPDLIRRIGAATAAELRVTGAEWTFAPTVTVPRDDRWGRTYEGYSEDPRVVASYAGPMVEGLQGKLGSPDFLDQAHVVSTAKHFLGDGATSGGKDQGDTRISEAELRDIHSAGYVPALEAGLQSVMASYSSWNGSKMHGDRGLLTDVLKDRMGFDGFVVGDWNGHGQIPGCTPTDCAATFNAGLDMAMAPDSWRGLYESTLRDAKSGRLPMARLDDAVARILRVKLRAGLLDAPKPSARALGGKFEMLGSAEHRAIARQAVRESLVLLKNGAGVLPLSPRANVLVAGDGADSVAKQSGGWTLSWQGTGTSPQDFPHAQSIWAGLEQQVDAAGGHATLSKDGSYSRKPDVAIVVFGEEPYAEFQGDIATLAYKPGDDTDLALLKRLKGAGIPVVSVFLSGRPLWVNREINSSDAFVAAWLPGSEGGGVADVLLRKADGSVAHDFHGKLSFSWPRTAMQTPLNVGDAGYDPQFAFGYGLRYGDSGSVAALPEISGVTGAQSAGGVFFARGKLAPGWSLRLQGAAGAATAIDGNQGRSGDGTLRMTSLDHQAQEDARRLQWSDTGAVTLAAPDALDLSRETNGDVMLVVTMRIDSRSATDAAISAGCGEGCLARVTLGEAFDALPQGEWLTFGVPLKCFGLAGADMTRIDQWRIAAGAGMDMQLSRVALAADAGHRKTCRAQ